MKPLKILIVNKFYYPRGGDCVAALSMEKLLKEKGHEVAVFSMQYPLNLPSPWSRYFPPTVNFSGKGLINKLKASIRIFYSIEVINSFSILLKEFKPDVVHLHNIHSYLSPVVARIASRYGIRVVWTLHDYKLICPVYTCLRNNAPCELCFVNKWNVVKYKCMKKNLFASILSWAEIMYWNRNRLERFTHIFISPSSFLKQKMIMAGYPAEKIRVLPNFMHTLPDTTAAKGNYYCYVGRISEEKGIHSLLEVAQSLPFPLKIVGDGELLKQYQDRFQMSHIEFTGHLSTAQTLDIIRKARFLVIPSLWYENNPFCIIESLCCGTPVLGADIGGIPELIDDGHTGFLFEPGDPEALKSGIIQCFNFFTAHYNFNEIALNAQNKFSKETFYNHLIDLYEIRTK